MDKFSQPQPGWYPDPAGASLLRYWDGVWTQRWAAMPDRERGSDVTVRTELTLEELAVGVKRDVDVTTDELCPRCQGSCVDVDAAPTACGSCGGQSSSSCPTCRGAQRFITAACPACAGEGRTRGRRTVTCPIPAGVRHLTKIRLPAQGEAGRGGGTAGDLYVEVVELPHPRFVRDGADLHCPVEVTEDDARTGTEITVVTLSGSPLVLTVPRGRTASYTEVVGGRGMPKFGSQARGDLHVHVTVTGALRQSPGVCPCCGEQELLSDKPMYLTCPVCYWRSDPVSPGKPSAANNAALDNAKLRYMWMGAADPQNVHLVRPPRLSQALPYSMFEAEPLAGVWGLAGVRLGWIDAEQAPGDGFLRAQGGTHVRWVAGFRIAPSDSVSTPRVTRADVVGAGRAEQFDVEAPSDEFASASENTAIFAAMARLIETRHPQPQPETTQRTLPSDDRLVHGIAPGGGALAEALRWWSRRVPDGEAPFTVAFLLELDRRDGLDAHPEVVLHYEQAARCGHRDAQFALGSALEKHGDDDALAWYLLAAQSGHPEASRRVGEHKRDRVIDDAPGVDWREGALYAVPDDGRYQVVKVLRIDQIGAHVATFSNRYDQLPHSVDESTLYRRGFAEDFSDLHSGEPMGIGHLPLSSDTFAGWQPMFIQQSSVRDDELTGYRSWLESSGGYF